MSSQLQLSKSEQQYIISGIHYNHRLDGRSLLDYRDVQVETAVLRGTHGSARIRQGDTELLCGIRVELQHLSNQHAPEPEITDLLEFKIDCSPNASPDFTGRGGQDISDEISDVLSKSWSKCTALMINLTIVPKKFYWKIYVDLLVLECGGTLLDACSLAAHAGMRTTILPKIKVEEGDEFEPDVSLADDPLCCQFLPSIVEAPLIITIHKIGQRHVVDPSLEEESCSSAYLTVALSSADPKTYLLIKKGGTKSLDMNSITEMLGAAKQSFQALHKSLARVYETKRVKQTNVTSCINSIGYMVD